MLLLSVKKFSSLSLPGVLGGLNKLRGNSPLDVNFLLLLAWGLA
jgi:hypothetical protein